MVFTRLILHSSFSSFGAARFLCFGPEGVKYGAGAALIKSLPAAVFLYRFRSMDEGFHEVAVTTHTRRPYNKYKHVFERYKAGTNSHTRIRKKHAGRITRKDNEYRMYPRSKSSRSFLPNRRSGEC